MSVYIIVLSTNGDEIELAENENPEILESPDNETDNTEGNVIDSSNDTLQEFMLDENGEEFVNEVLTFGGPPNSLTVDQENVNFDNDYHGYFDESHSTPEASSTLISNYHHKGVVFHTF